MMETFFSILIGGVISALLSIFILHQYGPFAVALLTVVVYGLGFLSGFDTERRKNNIRNMQSQVRLFGARKEGK